MLKGGFFMLTRFEMARIISARALQLSLGAPVLAKISKKVVRAEDVANIELEKKVLPISVIRVMPNGEKEVFDVNS